MGNNESRVYQQVSAGSEDPTSRGKTEDLMFVFHTSDDDSSDRVVHDRDEDGEIGSETWPYYITCSGRLIAERQHYSEPVENENFFKHVRPGDAVEFVKAGKRHHWAVYVGSDMFVHLHQGKITEIHCQEICKDRRARLANNVYKQKFLPAVQIINNAQTQVGKSSIWCNSECFAMWCRTGRAEFTTQETEIQNLDSKSPKISPGKYVLEMQFDGQSSIKRFPTLSALTEFRRNVEKHGKEAF